MDPLDPLFRPPVIFATDGPLKGIGQLAVVSTAYSRWMRESDRVVRIVWAEDRKLFADEADAVLAAFEKSDEAVQHDFERLAELLRIWEDEDLPPEAD
jgi:hypothetical protein